MITFDVLWILIVEMASYLREAKRISVTSLDGMLYIEIGVEERGRIIGRMRETLRSKLNVDVTPSECGWMDFW